jgi:hypothetical protein
MLTDREIREIERNTDFEVFNSGDGKIVAVNRNDWNSKDIIIRLCGMQPWDIINYLILCAQWSDSPAGDLKTLKTSLKN